LKILAKKDNNRYIVQLSKNELYKIIGSNVEPNEDDVVEISPKLSVLKQLSKRKGKLNVVFTELLQMIEIL